MFRLLRLVIFTAGAFIAGVLTERSNAQANCEAANGNWTQQMCIRSDIPHD
ncbi:hypothetical protein SAMN04488005_2204 [Yoonia tamlensis]|uniref:Uncharacterized protein n=1 Tax=Yoonia tamlensis TaxID=390270 RepID=A0A1I6GUT5_9RHOB|nr:hypothetical protein [Yoonia tamlensis]SFR46033.1 hypothetical protein SAMN04488005_2204 [Yoonia tamlensis]